MSRRLTRLAALIAAVTLIAGACASENEEGADSAADGSAGSSDIVACQVTDTGGVDDASFNQTANDGLVRAESELGVKTKLLESKSETDFEPNLNEFVDQGCDLIIPVGFLLADATATSAEENPDQLYSIVDYDYFDTDAGNDITYDNVEELTFATDQAAFLAGYLAAGTTKTGVVGTFGGLNIPTVTIFMDGYLAGIQTYNEDTGDNVQVLGWDGTDGQFVGNFGDLDAGKSITKSLIDEGADVVLPVAGRAGKGSVEAVRSSGGDVLLIWVDTDGCTSLPEDCDLFLTSIEKKMDNAVYDSIKSVVDGTFTGGVYKGTLENEGVGIPELSTDIPSELADKVEEYKAAIIEGNLAVSPS